VDVYTYDDEDNVLARLLMCAIHYRADYVLRICGDSPFLDVGMAEELIHSNWVANATYKEKDYDYIAHYLGTEDMPTVHKYAWGCMCELVRTKALFRCHYFNDLTDEQREHPTMCVYQHPELFNIKKVPMEHVPTTCSIDTEDDLKRARKIMKRGGVGYGNPQ
jgi:spore coat polysaccharide biosynthesis protein SpsF (cytidylyltransferase family)